MLKIEKGVPIPLGKTKRIYPLKEMEVGDSIFIPSDGFINICARVNPQAKKLGIKVATRKVEGGYRVWRTE